MRSPPALIEEGSVDTNKDGTEQPCDVWSSPIENIEKLTHTLEDKEKYRSLLQHHGPKAQKILDRIQLMLDSGMAASSSRSSVSRITTVALQRIVSRTGYFPHRYVLQGVEKEDEEAFARGFFGEIFRGRHGGARVCIKMLRINQKDHDKVMKFYAYEAILWSQLRHPNILVLFGVCTIDHKPCMISRWAENGNVREYIEMNPTVNRLSLIGDVTNGLAYLHAEGVVHGDLKGLNVLVNQDGHACLADFGLASVYDQKILTWSSQPLEESTGGTPRWQAPELLSDDKVRNTKSTDIYAWACTSYEIFTGELPYHDIKMSPLASFQVILRKHKDIPPCDASQRIDAWTEAGLDDDIWNLLNKCWVSRPLERPTIEVVQKLVHSKQINSTTHPDGSQMTPAPTPARRGDAQPYGSDPTLWAQLRRPNIVLFYGLCATLFAFPRMFGS